MIHRGIRPYMTSRRRRFAPPRPDAHVTGAAALAADLPRWESRLTQPPETSLAPDPAASVPRMSTSGRVAASR
jgi:hypothetical protein